MAASLSSVAPRPGRDLLGHPAGLFVLFFAELWERFSYYGMRAILVFYLTKHFLFDKQFGFAVYGAYTSLVYITPILGGYIADRLLGARKAVLAGGVFIAAGHLLIGLLEGPQGARGAALEGFYLGLALIIVGTGFLKANISVLVGQLYPRDDARRDPAFSLFYMGINTGAFVGPILCGYLGERVGWSWGFGAAGVGMLLGLVVFVLFRGELRGVGGPPRPEALARRIGGAISVEWTIYAGGAAMVLLAWNLVRSQGAVGVLLAASAAATLAYILYRSVWTLPRVERDRVFGALLLIGLSPVCWALFEQAGSSLNTFTDERVDRVILGWDVPASMFQAVNSIFIILLAPAFAGLWAWLGRRGWEPSAPFKFGIGLILIGAGFFVLIAGAGGAGASTPAVFVVLLYLFHSMGELCFSPVGLSSMTRLSIPSMTGLMMGTWFLATAAGNFIAGLIAQATGGGDEASSTVILSVYSRIGWFAMGLGAVVLVLAPLIARLMHLDLLRAPVDHALAGEPQFAEPAAAGTRISGETLD